ncbi:MAG: YitT family protein [Clostridia bacterium]|nr:YitT family protein [Clostridia bacterium]
MKKLFTKEQLLPWAQILFGCLVGAASYPWFLTPNHIAPGGITGIATVLNYLFQWPVGTVSLILNIPLFLIGYKAMGKSFVIRSLVATVLLSLFIDFLPLKPMTDDPLLGSIFGGVLLGIGLGFVLKGGATTGGTDMAARVVHNHIPYLSVGLILFAIDCLVVILAGFQIEVKYALYAFICLYVSSKMIDVVMEGLTTEKACYISSLKWDSIRQALMEELGRGVTLISAKGGYRGEERPMVLCVVSAQELGRLKTIVRREDPTAFVYISDAHEVLGEGFRKLEAGEE